MKIRPVGAELFHVGRRTDGRTDRRDGANRRFPQFLRKRLKKTGEELFWDIRWTSTRHNNKPVSLRLNQLRTTNSGSNSSSVAPHRADSEERSDAFAPVHITSVDMRGRVSIAGNQFSCDFNRVRRYAVTHMAGFPTKTRRPQDVQKANEVFDKTTLAVCKHKLPADFGVRTCDPSIIGFRDVPS